MTLKVIAWGEFPGEVAEAIFVTVSSQLHFSLCPIPLPSPTTILSPSLPQMLSPAHQSPPQSWLPGEPTAHKGNGEKNWAAPQFLVFRIQIWGSWRVRDPDGLHGNARKNPPKPSPQRSAGRSRDFHFPMLFPVNSWERPDSNLKPTCLWSLSLPSFLFECFSRNQLLRNDFKCKWIL